MEIRIVLDENQSAKEIMLAAFREMEDGLQTYMLDYEITYDGNAAPNI